MNEGIRGRIKKEGGVDEDRTRGDQMGGGGWEEEVRRDKGRNRGNTRRKRIGRGGEREKRGGYRRG